MNARHVVVIGAGPAGLEVALTCLELGHRVTVLERGEVGETVCRWGHVRLFSPWSLNTSARGRAALARQGVPLPDDAAFPTGADYVASYLLPVAADVAARGTLATGHAVIAISRDGLLKGEHIGGADRTSRPFRLLCDTPHGEAVVFADVVVDASGTYGNGNALGPGGAPAVGERALRDRILSTIPDVRGADRARFADRHALVVGDGYSAITVLRELLTLRDEAPATRISWALRPGDAPYARIPGDTLPERDALAALGNELAAGARGVEVLRGDVVAVRASGAGLTTELRTEDGALAEVEADELVALVGYRPDVTIYGELQVHTCYGSDGPMKLAAQLMASDGGGGDCLAQTSAGPDVLRTPEPDFYVIGSKSYGRRSTYLLKLGVEQAEDLASLLG